MSNKKRISKFQKSKQKYNRKIKIFDYYQLGIELVMGSMERAQDRIKLSQMI